MLDETYKPGHSHPSPRLAQIAAAIVLQIDGGASVITTGQKAGFIQIPYAGTITGWTLLADQAGSVVLDIWKCHQAMHPPTIADSITGWNKPDLTDEIQSSGGVIGWATDIDPFDIFAFNVDSVAIIKKLTLTLTVQKDL